jgi:hypothetical protein
MDKIEFEDEAPLELTGEDELDEVSRTELNASSKLTQVFEADTKQKDERAARMKQTPKPLRLHKKAKTQRKFHDKDYITIRCNLCEMDYTHAKKDDEGNFIQFALCQHVVFKGMDVEE